MYYKFESSKGTNEIVWVLLFVLMLGGVFFGVRKLMKKD